MRGHVRKRGKGNWYAVLSVRDPGAAKLEETLRNIIAGMRKKER
jgi:hypothetical protein